MDPAETFDAWRFEQPAVTVVLYSVPLMSDRKWKTSVAADIPQGRTVFVTEDHEPWVHVHTGRDSDGEGLPQRDDLAAACRVLVERGLAQPGQAVCSLGLDDHLPAPLDCPFTRTRVYSPPGLRQHLATVNAGYIADVIKQLRSPLGVVPFVGAGMSAKFGFPMWDRFLHDAAAEFDLGAEVDQLLSERDYEGAAELLDSHDRGRFTDQIVHAFQHHPDAAELRTGAISYLPLLSSGPVITTNFDPVLEDAFGAADRPLRVIDGPREDPTVAAVHGNERALLKIHGTYNDRTFRVFTKDEYKRGYEEGSVNLESLAWLTFTNRPLLFLGCSLESDRTVGVLAEIHRRLEGLRHYAILAAHYTVARQSERMTQLSKCGVKPIWYPPGEFDRITEILRELVEGSATEPIRAAARPRRRVMPEGDERPLRAVDIVSAPMHPETPAVAERITDGKLAFFLGAYAHLGALPLGDAFYADLAKRFDCPALAGDRSAVAAFVARRRGSRTLWEEVRRSLDTDIQASPVYRMIAALPGFLRSRGRTEPTWIFTTNYDTVLERELGAAREPFHLLYYMEERGVFAHAAPDGSVRAIHGPEAIRDLGDAATVVVKLNGGMVRDTDPPESVVIASGQFERLAARIPDALPDCVRQVLRERALLFLGHGIAEPDVNELIARYAVSDPFRWWAVRLPPADPDARQRWQERTDDLAQSGVVTIDCDLEAFMGGLRARLLAS